MELTNLWTKNNGLTFVHEGCNIQVGRKMYRNVKPDTLIQLGYIQKGIEYVPAAELPNYTDGQVYYEDYQRNFYVHYEEEYIPEPEPENQ